MCGGAPSMPSMPAMPPPPEMPPAAPTPPPMPEPAAPLPAPAAVNAGSTDNAKMQKRTSKRGQLQQAAGGTSPLKIALDKSVNTQTDNKKGNLNIPT
jgi:hypothetical protein